MSYKSLCSERWAQWKKDALAGGMPQSEIDTLEASFDERSAAQNVILRARTHCGLPLRELRDQRGYTHVGCSLGIEMCPERFLVALETEHLKEIRGELS